MGTGERGFAVVVTTTVLAAVLWPLRQHLRPTAERVDGFPLSYYPMFSLRRRRHGGITYVLAVGADGNRRYLRHSLLGPAGINQVRRQLYRLAVRERGASSSVTGGGGSTTGGGTADSPIRISAGAAGTGAGCCATA